MSGAPPDAPPPEAEAARARRSLTHVGGEVTRGGHVASSEALAEALDVAPAGETDDEPERADVHGFHVYPARMHPTTASRLVRAFVPEGGHVLDPFCGSGTVPVEAVASGRQATGTDLNPLAVKLAKAKLMRVSPEDAQRIHAEAQKIRALADTRRKAKAGATRRYPREDTDLFDPHVLLELDSLRSGIADADPAARGLLELVLSSLLVKVSRQRGDTSRMTETRRLAAGYTAKLFVRKTEELLARLEAFAARCPERRPRSRIVLDDATRLETIADASIDGVVTSPPYVATYDYAEHHEVRARWLGLSSPRFFRDELGSRRAYAERSPEEARRAWLAELTAMLDAMARVVRPGGNVVLLMADSAIGRVALRADELVADACEAEGRLVPHARASQVRPHFHGPTQGAFRDEPRREHALLLVRRAFRPRGASKGAKATL